MSGILHGMRVVEVSAFVAAPLGGATLAELGAEVVRVEPPGGGIDIARWPLHDGRSLYRAGLDQGKRSVAIDMRTPTGQRLVTDLVARAGIMLTNLPAQGWSSYERLAERRRDLILELITGNPDGTIAVDYTVNAAVGFPLVTGPEGRTEPVDHVLPAWDLLTGYLAATGIVAAEMHRRTTGEGQFIRVSLMDVALSIEGHLGFIAEAQVNAEPRRRIGNYVYGQYGRDFATSDGRRIMVLALTPRQWSSLMEATGLGPDASALAQRLGLDLRQEAARFEAREQISALLEPWIGSRTLAELASTFSAHEVLWGPYQTFKELVTSDPRCSVANPLFTELEEHGIGRTLRAGSPLFFGRMPRKPAATAPSLARDTRDVLRTWLGLGQDEIAALARDNVIGLDED